MKKILTVLAAVLVSATVSMAQNSTKMGADHKWTYGAALSHTFSETVVEGETKVYNSGLVAFERNSENNNYRTRISLGWLERTHFCPSASVDAQYLFPLGETGIYVYPSVGAYCVTFHKEFNVGAQAAAGLELQLGSRLGIFAEAKYQHLFLNGGIDRLQAGAGLKIAFGK